MTQRKHSLYRYFDANGGLLYIGVSKQPVQRLGEHRGEDWSGEIARIDVAYFPTRDAALNAEQIAIARERPRHNRDGPDVLKPVTGLREMRRLRGIGQIKLAKMLGTRQSAISKWETGTNKPRPNTIKRIAAALDCSPSDLV